MDSSRLTPCRVILLILLLGLHYFTGATPNDDFVAEVRDSEEYRALSDEGLCAQCPFAGVDEGSGCFGRKSAAEYSTCAEKTCFCAQESVNTTVNYIMDFVRDKCPGEQTWPGTAIQAADSYTGYCGLAAVRPLPIEEPLSTSASSAPLPTSSATSSAPATSSTSDDDGGGGGGPGLSTADIIGIVMGVLALLIAAIGIWLDHKNRWLRRWFGVTAQGAADPEDQPRRNSDRFNVHFNNLVMGQRQEHR
ncbi:uncharacterized protein J7T54_005060 [Emericellopsis cladophorae]|uniref:Extracellular membrane protein CFEM domain-containing protein n=1 Tax=Emericellopsis cladophorae TaxID=2686198 RepID=A0A9Q0BBD5_9HYPO|nr:uncharacterized protein J7T54_005060 [Emericellopsis cladophorae]KAI6778536.1 hypothetical protein J7T54_005060 [Emericellopsis cladophorae]